MEDNRINIKERHAFIVGIKDYIIIDPLKTATHDATALADVLKNQYGYNIHSCLNPNRDELIQYIKNMKNIVETGDCVVFYFAGHGTAINNEHGMEGFICPTDADRNKENETMIAMSFLNDCFSKLKCHHFLLILDCCFAGAFRWSEKTRAIGYIANNQLFKQHYHHYIQNASWQVLTSASHTQEAKDYIGAFNENTNKHSPFAKYLIDGLKGQAGVNDKKMITVSALFAYVKNRISMITGMTKNAQDVGFFPLKRHEDGEFMFLDKDFKVEALTKADSNNPYMGLQSYSQEKAHLFFGREEAIKDLLQKIKNNRFVVVVGASGTGKSSLVNAGVIPKLKGSGHKNAEMMRPNKNPVAELANLKDFDVLIIDQFEEIVTQSDPNKAAEFIKILRGYIEANQKTIILTVRIDFESQIDKTGIETAWQKGRFVIPPFTHEELRDIIATPAARVGRFIEPIELISTIVNEVEHYPGSLPLLSFTMSELFEKCKNHLYHNIRQEDYDALKGVTGALQKSADRIVEQLNEAEQQTLKNIMFRMVSFSNGEKAGKRLLRSDLRFDEAAEDARVSTVINKLDTARLIVSNTDRDNQPFIEPAHDALVRTWGTLHEWMKKFQDDNLLLLSKVNLAVLDYQTNNQNDIFLWDRHPSLEQALALQCTENTEGVIFNAAERAFLKKSREKQVNEIEALKVERDEARKETRAANNSALALTTINTDQTLALRIADYNVKQHTTKDVVKSVFHDIISNNSYRFYNQRIDEGYNVIGAFSPNGETFLTAGTDNVAKLWSLDGQLITILEGHEKKKVIKSIAFSSDGRRILTGSTDGTAKLWLLDKQAKRITQPQVTFEGINGGGSFSKGDIGLNSVVFSPNGQTVLGISIDKTAKLWSIEGELMAIFEEPNEAISLIAYSPNGETVLTVSSNKIAKLWSLDAKVLSVFEGHDEAITAIAFSPDGDTILTGSSDQTVKLWSLEGEVIRTFEGNKGKIMSITFSPNGKMVLIFSNEHVLWSLEGQILLTLSHKRSIDCFAFSPDSKKIVTGSYDFTAKLWSVDGNVESIFDNVSPITGIAFSPDGKKILTVDFARVKLWSTGESNIITKFPVSTTCRLSPNHEMILAGEGNVAKLWSLDGQLMRTFEGHQTKINYVLFSPDGKHILTSDECIVKLWSLDGQLIATFEGHQARISSIAFSPTGERILTNSSDKTAKLWSLDGENLTTFPYKNPRIYFTFYENGNSLLMQIQGRKTKKRWSLKGELLDTFESDVDEDAVIFYPNGKTKLSLVQDKAIFYSVDGEIITDSIQHQTILNSAVFSTDGKTLATGDYDGIVKLWSLDGKTIMTLPEHKEGISFIEFTNDGKKIVTSDGKTVRVSMTPQYFLDERVYNFSLQELYKVGVQLEPSDLLMLEIDKPENNAILEYKEQKEKLRTEKGRRIIDERRSGSTRINEARLLILGEGGAGKTSLQRKLIDTQNDLPTIEESTRGINIEQIICENTGGDDFIVKVWDFGGQNIQHYAHQFFMSDSVVYAVLSNTREQNTNFQYWLNIIKLLGKNSPFFIIQNEREEHKEPLSNIKIQEEFPVTFKGVQQVNLKEAATDGRFDILKRSLLYTATQLPHTQQERPTPFFKVRQKLERLSQSQSTIPFTDFRNLCKEEGVEDSDLIADYAKWMTELGTILYFPNDISTKRELFLNPQLIIDALFELLYHPSVIEQKGYFTETDADSIWQGNQYEGLHDILLKFMVKFRLCYKTNRQEQYILPQRLPARETPFVLPNDATHLIYKYKFLPSGLLTQLTCGLHEWIEGEKIWSDAVQFVTKDGKGRVFVRENSETHLIELFGFDTQKADLLNRVVEDLDAIHMETKLKNLVVEKLVPCPCAYCRQIPAPHFFNYDVLKRRLQNGKIKSDCGKSDAELFIAEILQHANIRACRVEEIRNLIAEGRANEALNLLRGRFPMEKTFDLLSSRWHNLIAMDSEGRIGLDEKNAVLRKLEKDILETGECFLK